MRIRTAIFLSAGLLGILSVPVLANLNYCDFNLSWKSSPICGSNSLNNVDPLFVGPTLNRPENFKLKLNSPARGRGRNGENIGAYARGDEVIGIRSKFPPLSEVRD